MDNLNYTLSGGMINAKVRRLQTMTIHLDEVTGRFYVTDDKFNGRIRSGGHATIEAAVKLNKAADERRYLCW